MQVIFKSDRYQTFSTSKRAYPTNQPIEIDSDELAKLREDLKNVPDLEILERKPKIGQDDLERIEAIIQALTGRSLDAQESLLLQSFEELSPVLRQELRLRVLMAVTLPNDLKRKCDSLLASVEIWDKTYVADTQPA